MTKDNDPQRPAVAERNFGALANFGVSEERYGEAVLRLRDSSMFAAQNVALPNGTRGKPTCITLPKAPFERSVWLRPLADGTVGRRGRLVVEEGRDVRFVDEPDADVPPPDSSASPRLDYDPVSSDDINCLARTKVGAALIYGALANAAWRHEATGTEWSCSSRTAGGIAASLHDGGDYLGWAWHPTGGLIDEHVLRMIEGLGWRMVVEEKGG